MSGLNNDKRCLTHNLRVKKYWNSKRIIKLLIGKQI